MSNSNHVSLVCSPHDDPADHTEPTNKDEANAVLEDIRAEMGVFEDDMEEELNKLSTRTRDGLQKFRNKTRRQIGNYGKLYGCT